jgi:regulator of sigma E protease
VNGEPVATWFDVRQRLQEAASDEKGEVMLTIEQGSGQGGGRTEVAVPMSEASREAILQQPIHFSLTFVDNPGNAYETIRQTKDPFQAMWWGGQETKLQIVKLYVTLKRVIYDQTVPASNLTGPVGILHFGSILAQKGPDWLLWFLAMISANLAVVNFLPIPILDGGHMVFLASEKITGKPPSPKVQTAALYAGLIMIASLVLFVTYNDIQRLPFF